MIWNIINRDDLFHSVLISVRAPSEVLGRTEVRDSISVVSWHMPASITPMSYAISVRSDNSIKDMISKAGNFVINFMGNDQKSIVLSAENQDGLFVDLFDFLGISRADSDFVESPKIKEARAALECEVDQELDSGDHTIFIGKVVGPRV